MSPSHPRRLALATAAIVAVCALTAAPALARQSPAPDRLRILVTNDDGWRGDAGADTPYIVALRDALVADGHDVTVVAPATDQSGNSARLTFTQPLTLAAPLPDVFTVSGSPADSVFLGRQVLFGDAPPDLVVSGINPGGNFSSILNQSGTVGAAVAALQNGVPSIAVSLDGSAAQTLPLRATVAEYTTDLIDALVARYPTGSLLPEGVGLNVNYPAARPVTGTQITVQDPGLYLGLRYATAGTFGEPGVYTLGFGPPTASPIRGGDWSALRNGRISITPIDADRTVDSRTLRRYRFLAEVPPSAGR